MHILTGAFIAGFFMLYLHEPAMYLAAMIIKPQQLVFSYGMVITGYLVALFSAWQSAQYFITGHSLLVTTLYADIVATSVIFIFSSAFRNASFYDPYWSVVPFFIALFWISEKGSDLIVTDLMLLAVLAIWGLRLTLNWIRGWNGLGHEDWRYGKLRQQTGKFYPFVNFLGIHLFPTLIVLLAMLPAYYAIIHPAENINLPVAGIAACKEYDECREKMDAQEINEWIPG